MGTPPLDKHKLDEIRSHERMAHDPVVATKPFGPEWGSESWGKWQTASHALYSLGIPRGATVLDVGMGYGWTSVFLAESGFRPTGIDISPANVGTATARAARCQVQAEFVVADMDDFDLGRTFDAALVFDALHHSARQSQVVARIAAHLAPGGWVLLGEPSWLHGLSPHARKVTRDLGWMERGVRVRQLRRDCDAAGLGDFRRFHEGTQPHAGRLRDLVYQTARLWAATAASAPQMSVWLAARRT